MSDVKNRISKLEEQDNISDVKKRISKLEEKDKVRDELINKLLEQNQNLMKTNKKESSQIIL